MNAPLDLVEFSGRAKTSYLPQGEASECALAWAAQAKMPSEDPDGAEPMKD